MSLTFSRRSFLKYTAVAAVAVAGSSLLTGCKDNPYQPEGGIGDSLKIMGTFTMNSAALEDKTLTCNMTFKCTSDNPLYVRPSSFQIEVIDADDNKTIYRANQAKNNKVNLDTTDGDLKKNDEYTTNLTVMDITVKEGDTIKVKYWPRDQASGDYMSYTKAFATWVMTYKEGKLV